MRLWVAVAALGVIGGGNFHAHYYQQLVPPLGVLAGIGVAAIWEARARAWVAAGAAAAVVALAFTAPLWFDSPDAQAREVFPNDPHLLTDAAVVRYVRAHTRPGQRIFVLWAAADIYYLADRDPAVRYMWYRNIQAIPGALGEARRALAGPDPPALVVVENLPGGIDQTGATARILAGSLPPRRGRLGRPDLRAAPLGETMTTLENRPNAALLVIDVQNDALARAHERDAVIANVSSLVERARREGVPVVWVQHFDERPCTGERRLADRL